MGPPALWLWLSSSLVWFRPALSLVSLRRRLDLDMASIWRLMLRAIFYFKTLWGPTGQWKSSGGPCSGRLTSRPATLLHS
jgi:hypothetical protein